MLDLSKLSPAPWKIVHDEESGSDYIPDHSGYPMLLGEDDLPMCCTALEFAALARNAFDVMMRRGWSAIHTEDGWYAIDENGDGVESIVVDDWPDPFSALVEADRWYRQNIEKE